MFWSTKSALKAKISQTAAEVRDLHDTFPERRTAFLEEYANKAMDHILQEIKEHYIKKTDQFSWTWDSYHKSFDKVWMDLYAGTGQTVRSRPTADEKATITAQIVKEFGNYFTITNSNWGLKFDIKKDNKI